MIITSKIKMDLSARGVTERVDAVQDDKYSRNLEFSLYANGVAWSVPSGTTVLVRYEKPDGKGGSYNTMPDGTAACTIAGSVVTVRLAPQVCTVSGLVKLAVCLLNGTAELNTFSVGIHVRPNPGINAISEDYINVSGLVSASGWSPNVYLGTDSKGNVVEKPAAGGTGMTPEQAAQLEQNTQDIAALPISVDDAGYTDIAGLRRLVSGSVVRDGQTITITTNYQGNVTHEEVIALDENDIPVSITSDGIEAPWTFQGFEATDAGEAEA